MFRVGSREACGRRSLNPARRTLARKVPGLSTRGHPARVIFRTWGVDRGTGFQGLRAQQAAIKTADRRATRGGGGGERCGMVSFVHDDSGQGLVEYALIIAVIAVAVIVALVFLRDQISNIFSDIGNNLT